MVPKRVFAMQGHQGDLGDVEGVLFPWGYGFGRCISVVKTQIINFISCKSQFSKADKIKSRNNEVRVVWVLRNLQYPAPSPRNSGNSQKEREMSGGAGEQRASSVVAVGGARGCLCRMRCPLCASTGGRKWGNKEVKEVELWGGKKSFYFFNKEPEYISLYVFLY